MALYVCASLLPLSFVVGIEALLFDRMWGSAVSLGVWAGLRWASQPLSAISVVILSVLFATVPLAVGLILYPAVTLSLMGCVGLILAAWMPRLSSYLNKIARKHAIQLIATQTGV